MCKERCIEKNDECPEEWLKNGQIEGYVGPCPVSGKYVKIGRINGDEHRPVSESKIKVEFAEAD